MRIGRGTKDGVATGPLNDAKAVAKTKSLVNGEARSVA